MRAHVRITACLLGLFVYGCGKTAPPSSDAAPSALEAMDLWTATYDAILENGSAISDYKVVVKKNGTTHDVVFEGKAGTRKMHFHGQGRPPPPGSGGGALLTVHFMSCADDDTSKCAGYTKGERIFSMRIVPDAYLLDLEKLPPPQPTTKNVSLRRNGANPGP